MDWFSYPTFEVVTDRRVIPRIFLPENYLDLVPRFYEIGGKATVNAYAKDLEELLDLSGTLMDIRLNWDDKKGLANISVGTQGGLDLNESSGHFQEHNLGWLNSFIAGSVAMKYISELLKSR